MPSKRDLLCHDLKAVLRNYDARLVQYEHTLHGGSAYRLEIREPEGRSTSVGFDMLYDFLHPLGLAEFKRPA